MVIVVGFVIPVRSPLHPVNDHPAKGAAVSVTMVPDGYVD
jgi:hypothetical protein